MEWFATMPEGETGASSYPSTAGIVAAVAASLAAWSPSWANGTNCAVDAPALGSRSPP